MLPSIVMAAADRCAGDKDRATRCRPPARAGVQACRGARASSSKIPVVTSSGAPRLAARPQAQSRRCLELRETAAKTKLFKPIGDKATRRRIVSPRSRTGCAAEDCRRSCRQRRPACPVRRAPPAPAFSTSTPKSERREEACCTTRSSPRA